MMPWHVVKDIAECGKGKWAVVKDIAGDVEGCHMSEQAAHKQMAALYASESGRAQMTAADINDLRDDQFAYIEPGGKKDETGRTVPRSLRHFPIHDAAHVRNALARAPQSPFGKLAMPKILAAAKKFGIEVSEPPRSRPLGGFFVRAFDFESRGSGDGRTLEGYAAVFGRSARIRDLAGDFDEVIAPGAFARSLDERQPVLQFEHGKDPRVGAVPIGAIQDLREDGHGLYVRAALFDNPVVEPVRQAIAGKAIKGMSFRFSVPDGGDRWTRNGTVDQREIRDADVFELGPVVFPAYDATSVGVRSLLAHLDPDDYRALLRELAAELRLAADLDLTGRPGARSAGGGDTGTSTTGRGDVPAIPPSVRIATDGDSLRLRGIIK